jgi:twinkle protein
MFRGFRKGELYLVTAGSGVGKTTVAKEICHHFRTVHNLSLGVFSLEEGVKKATNGFISLSLNVPPFDIFGVPLDKRKKAFESLTADNKFWIYDHWGSSDIDRILSKIKFMAVSLGCDWILLDHISIIVSGSDELNNDERKLIDRFMTKLRTLIENTGVGVLAIVHLKRPPGDKGYTEGRKVSLSDLRGSGSLEQLSDGVIALERDQQGEQKNISQVRVLKNRPIGTTGKADVLHYDTGTGRLTNEIPTEDEIDDF